MFSGYTHTYWVSLCTGGVESLKCKVGFSMSQYRTIFLPEIGKWKLYRSCTNTLKLSQYFKSENTTLWWFAPQALEESPQSLQFSPLGTFVHIASIFLWNPGCSRWMVSVIGAAIFNRMLTKFMCWCSLCPFFSNIIKSPTPASLVHEYICVYVLFMLYA